MDVLTASLHHRFSGGDDTVLRGVEAVLAGDETEGRRVTAFCGLDADRLDLHLRFMHDMGRSPATLQEAAKMLPVLEYLVPEAARLVRLALTAPATSCTAEPRLLYYSAERSFSLMKRLKTSLRTSIGQARFNHLAICATDARVCEQECPAPESVRHGVSGHPDCQHSLLFFIPCSST